MMGPASMAPSTILSESRTVCLWAAKLAHKVLYILHIQLWLFPGHKVAAARKFGKVYQIDLTGCPFTWQGRIVRTMGHSSRNYFTLAQSAATRNMHIFVIRTSG